MATTTGWGRAATVVAGRMLELELSRSDLAQRAGVSDVTVAEVLDGMERSRRPSTLAKLSRALGWSPDSLARVLDGEAPLVDLSESDRQSADVRDQLAEMNGKLDRLAEKVERVIEAIAQELP